MDQNGYCCMFVEKVMERSYHFQSILNKTAVEGVLEFVISTTSW